LNKYKLN